MPRQMVVLLGPGDLTGEGSSNRGFSPFLPLELAVTDPAWRLALECSQLASCYLTLEWDQVCSLGRVLELRSGDAK